MRIYVYVLGAAAAFLSLMAYRNINTIPRFVLGPRKDRLCIGNVAREKDFMSPNGNYSLLVYCVDKFSTKESPDPEYDFFLGTDEVTKMEELLIQHFEAVEWNGKGCWEVAVPERKKEDGRAWGPYILRVRGILFTTSSPMTIQLNPCSIRCGTFIKISADSETDRTNDEEDSANTVRL